mmetsp:Transcript_63193/g.142527  ORF Transcript_63193/g.142527 Transcript_63193/m.142527 type:complete len:234 (+) Transcript_63193:156-857(+)|eukprot:CAMPEP_0172601444 /NCGR_PEP_ID=MMETSP1068-20121228/21586_1 /TAXON_ID=35684 /ORGANISM="Pseudopedinella elastica, Strain CCMP716" /LENGTH=233 /DNA_ID=CAMNT_0013402419 /DNA_START=72 /DNA_END=773 /DNA_ORIENTATION=-
MPSDDGANKRPRTGRSTLNQVCVSCEAKVPLEILKIPEFSAEMLLDDKGNLIMCYECMRTNVYEPATMPASNGKKSKVPSKAAGSSASSAASSSSSSSSSSAASAPRASNLTSERCKAQTSRKRVPTRYEPKLSINSYGTLVDWCIARYHDTSSVGNMNGTVSTPQDPASPSTSAQFNIPTMSPLDELMCDLPRSILCLLPEKRDNKTKPGARAKAPSKIKRKASAPKRIPPK